MTRSETKPPFTWWQRFTISLASYVGYFLVYVIGRTLRWEVRGWENWESIQKAGKQAIYSCWHRCIFPATYFWRKRGIVVMSGYHFDAQYTGRFIQMHGYGIARGSSARGGVNALNRMVRCLRDGRDVGFTIDGPRGPRYVAKVGPVLVAKRTGNPIFCFHISMKRKIQLNSWDHFQIPLPFTKALVLMAPPLYIPKDAKREALEEKRVEMETILNQMREEGDRWAETSAEGNG